MLSVKRKKRTKIAVFLILLLVGRLAHCWLSSINVVLKNFGVSFGMEGWFLVGLSFVFILLLIVFWWKNNYFGINFVIVGGVINLIDRIIFGYVRDYWKLGWVYNNLADWIIQIGIIIFLSELWMKKLK